MKDITQPFTKLVAANTTLITEFAQSPEMAELANTSAQKYFELAQKTFGRAAASNAHAELVRKLTENYSKFAHEYAESLMGMATEGQALMSKQVQEVSDQMAEASKTAVANASNMAKPSRTA